MIATRIIFCCCCYCLLVRFLVLVVMVKTKMKKQRKNIMTKWKQFTTNAIIIIILFYYDDHIKCLMCVCVCVFDVYHDNDEDNLLKVFRFWIPNRIFFFFLQSGKWWWIWSYNFFSKIRNLFQDKKQNKKLKFFSYQILFF